ncbi:MAG: hypothetical protein GWP15_02850 [Nitrospirae bacterium]|nr:hypothetical protein [Nitrospirota bacterium]
MTKTKTIIIETVGWMGTVLIVLAYFLISNAYVVGDSFVYQLMNLSGAVFLGISLVVKKAWPALTLQVIWSVIAVWALVTIWT